MLVNWGLAIATLGAVILTVGSFVLNPTSAFRETKGTIEVNPELLRTLATRLRVWLKVGLIVFGIGTIIQMVGNF